MPTDKEVADIYQKALDALSETIAARSGVTDQQKDLAEQKQKQLSMEFVGKVIINVEERTAKFQEFIGVMQALIDEFDPSITVEGIKELKGLVHDAGQLISAALPKAEVALPATAEKQTAGAQPKPTMAAVEPKPLAKASTSVAKPATGAKAKAKQPATPSTAKASKAGAPAAKAPPSATTKPGSKAKSAPAPKKPVKKKPSVAKPAAKKPAAKKPTTKKPVTKKPATKKPAAKRAPAQKKPVRKGKKPS